MDKKETPKPELMKCETCGKFFNIADLGQVFEHVHGNLTLTKPNYGKKIK